MVKTSRRAARIYFQAWNTVLASIPCTGLVKASRSSLSTPCKSPLTRFSPRSMLTRDPRCPHPSAARRPVPDIFEALQAIAGARRADPLAPVTVIAPSHAAALQLRRRLAALSPFAAVRFETLPRVAELVGAGHLAAARTPPLARPIGDYIAEQVALASRPPLDSVRDVPGYARVLRQIFRRLRRGGIRTSADVRLSGRPGHLAEMLRLYDLFADGTRKFYAEDDLLDAAREVVRTNRAGVLADLGDIYVVPPGPQTAAGAGFLAALTAATAVRVLDDPAASPRQSFLIAPDPASEAQEAVRLVLEALAAGTPMHEVAVFHGAAGSYARLLREAFSAAGVASVPLPGIPVAETRAGRGVLALARLPQLDYARTAVIDFLSVAPTKEWLPSTDGDVHEATTAWDKISRDAAVTRGRDVWRRRLKALARDREATAASLDATDNETRIAALQNEGERAIRLLAVIEALIVRLEPLRQSQSAADFIDAYRAVVSKYIDSKAGGFEEALEEIDQLGTIGAVGGEFALGSFAESLAANLEARYIRPEKLGSGVVIADYRVAAGMRFERVILCGAFEGAFPAGPGADSILDDGVWQKLRAEHPFIEDTGARIARAKEAAARAIASAGDGHVTWSAPAFEPGGAHDYYPSPMMAAAYSAVVGQRVTASALRTSANADSIRRLTSPLAAWLRGPILSTGELAVRSAIDLKRRGGALIDHGRYRSVLALKSRRSSDFTEWDGNLTNLNDPGWLDIQRAVSPTSLEHYAVCGYRYFCRSLLKLQVVDEPDEKQTMDAATRGSLIHKILETFFAERQADNRPQPNEAWTSADRDRLMQIADDVLSGARESGQTGLDIFLQHESRTIRADLARFLEADTVFRRETGAVPISFELAIPETDVAGVRLRGFADRIDRTPDGKKAWVIDYKTGSTWDVQGMEKDPLKGGAKLQLPVYLAAVSDAEEATALYWFITQRGDFSRITYTPSPERDVRFQDTLSAIVGGIRAGAFPAVPNEEDEWKGGFKNCTYCDFDRICSRRRDLEHAVKSGDDQMRPWQNVAAAANPGAGQ